MATAERVHAPSESTTPKMETVISFDPTQVEVTVTPVPHYTEAQLKNQKTFLADHHTELTAGDRLRQIGVNAAIFAGSTVVDLAESHVADKLIREKVNKMKQNLETLNEGGVVAIENIPSEMRENAWFKRWEARNKGKEVTLDGLKEHVKHLATTENGKKLAAEFVEEWGTDSLYAWAANSYVQMVTGVKGAKYVSETSAFIADWFIVWSQVFNKNTVYPTRFRLSDHEPEKAQKGWLGIKKAYEAADFVNAVNLEAAFRMIEAVPVFGDGVKWLHHKTDHLLESTIGSRLNTAASKGILGFHIGKNIKAL